MKVGCVMDITSKDIISLREKTGMSVKECYNALTYGKGDVDMAIAYLKARSLAVATPKLTFDERVLMFYSNN